MNIEKKSGLVKGQHIAFKDPEVLSQSELEEGLDQLTSMIKTELDEVEKISASTEEALKKNWARLTELRIAAASYREALGTTEPPFESEMAIDRDVKSLQDDKVREALQCSEETSLSDQLSGNRAWRASND